MGRVCAAGHTHPSCRALKRQYTIGFSPLGPMELRRDQPCSSGWRDQVGRLVSRRGALRFDGSRMG